MHVPIVMYGLKLFIVVLQELHCLHIGFIMSYRVYHITKYLNLLVSEILPEGVYCCFTKTTLFTTMFTMVICVYLLKSMTVYTTVYLNWLLYQLLYVPIVIYGQRLFIYKKYNVYM